MHEYKRTFTLPTLHVTLPCAPSQEIICIGGGRAPETGWLIGLIQQRNMKKCEKGVDVSQPFVLYYDSRADESSENGKNC